MHLFDEDEKLQAPDIRPTGWLNTTAPISLKEWRGQVVLVDFWDYTCVNCLHTLPYLKEWHRRYADSGLRVLGVHAAEFSFAKTSALIEKAVQDLDIPYPVALDTDYATWEAYGNRCWPAKYLIDAAGDVRAYHMGEGAYAEFEEWIQRLLRESQPDRGFDFPAPMAPVRGIDAPGALCPRPTPERYLGQRRGEFGNAEETQAGQTVQHAKPAHLLLDTVYLEGAWRHSEECVEKADAASAKILLQYRAAEVNLVLAPPEDSDSPTRVYLSQDREPLPSANRGADVGEDASGQTYVAVVRPNMYRLVKNPDFEMHTLVLSVADAGTRAYAFTFVSCPSRDTALA